jgi:rubrerythrin
MAEALMKNLTSLAQMDRDATSVYDEALKHVEHEEVKTRFMEFKAEHEQHVAAISAAIAGPGGGSPEFKVDLLGHLADWLTAFRGMQGERGALAAMRMGERHHNTRYEEAMKWDIADPEFASLLRRFYADEKRHLAFMESQLGRLGEVA